MAKVDLWDLDPGLGEGWQSVQFRLGQVSFAPFSSEPICDWSINFHQAQK